MKKKLLKASRAFELTKTFPIENGCCSGIGTATGTGPRIDKQTNHISFKEAPKSAVQTESRLVLCKISNFKYKFLVHGKKSSSKGLEKERIRKKEVRKSVSVHHVT